MDENGQTKTVKWYGRKRIIFPFLFLIILAAAIYFYWDINLRGFVSTDDAYIDSDRIAISSKILGRVDSLGTDEGEKVIKGQLLARIDDSDLLADKAQAEANIAFARQNTDLAGVSLELARDDFSRAKTQFESNIISAQDYDHANKALELARAKLNIARAAVKTAEAALEVITAKLANTKLFAPYNGIVAKKWILDGEVISPGQPIFTIYDLQDVWITANFEETKIASFRVGDPVLISVDAYPDQDYSGKVLFIGAATASQFSLIPPNNASGNFTKVTQRVPVKISVNNISKNPDKDAKIIPGMSAVVKVDAREKNQPE